MKRIFFLSISTLLLLGLTACGGAGASSASPTATPPPTESPTAAPTPGVESAESAAPVGQDLGNVLVVYFSASGHTESVAQTIADSTGGDLFELEPVEPYTDEDLNYGDENSRVVYEHENPDAQAVELVSDTPDSWDSYDTVFIGYPIWWGVAAWPVNDFVTANDFTGKTVIPFCTSASSGLGQSGTLLAELAGTGDWQEGMRFPSSVDAGEVETWVSSLSR